MASKRRLRRQSCKGKVIYLSYELAARAAVLARERTGDDIQPYPCGFCRSAKSARAKVYHIGHRPAQARAAEEASRAWAAGGA
jgi:hypothetical protein